MTIRNNNIQRQLKITRENGRYWERWYRLHPFSDILTEEHEITRIKVMAIVATNLAIQSAGESVVDLYINGKNYKKVVNDVW